MRSPVQTRFGFSIPRWLLVVVLVLCAGGVVFYDTVVRPMTTAALCARYHVETSAFSTSERAWDAMIGTTPGTTRVASIANDRTALTRLVASDAAVLSANAYAVHGRYGVMAESWINPAPISTVSTDAARLSAVLLAQARSIVIPAGVTKAQIAAANRTHEQLVQAQQLMATAIAEYCPN